MTKKQNTQKTTGRKEFPEVINDPEIENFRQDLIVIASALLDQMNYTGNRIVSGSIQNKLKLRAIIEKYSTHKTFSE